MSVFRREGGMFVQEDLDELFYLLTCTGVGDVTMPEGDVSPVYCPSPSSVGDFVIDGVVESEAGFVTCTLNHPLQSTLNWLLTELGDCEFHLRTNWRVRGSVPDVFDNYLLGLHLHTARIGSRTVGQPVVLSAADDERVETTADITSYYWRMVFPNTATRTTLTEVSAINGIAFDRSAACYTEEIGGDAIAKDGYFTTDHTATSPAVNADIWYTTDYGVTWTLCAADPFGAAEDAGPVVTRGGRVIVGRITADAGNAAEIAYSDDYGATWTNVDLGSTNSQIVNALWWQDWTHLWAACSGGYVYFSDDGGLTWTAQTSGGLTAQNLYDVCAYDQQNVWAVGAAGAIIRTVDGETWELVTGPSGVTDAFMTVWMSNSTRVFIGSDAGNVYVTSDGGTTWSDAFGTPQWSGGNVVRIRGELDLRYFLYVIGETSGGAGEIYRSEQGGAIGSWFEVEDLPANSGVNDLEVIDQNIAWVVGEPHAGTAYMARVHETS